MQKENKIKEIKGRNRDEYEKYIWSIFIRNISLFHTPTTYYTQTELNLILQQK